jgi:hypothetical protein
MSGLLAEATCWGCITLILVIGIPVILTFLAAAFYYARRADKQEKR